MSHPCIEYLNLTTGARCGRPGLGARLHCPAGRPDATGGPYCEEHGGASRSRAEAEQDWNYVAPESVGDAEAVQHAGQWGLRTPHAYVVLRHLPEMQGGTWLAWLGLGSHMQPIRRFDHGAFAKPNRRGGKKHKRHRNRAETGTYSWPSRARVEEAARDWWRVQVRGEVNRIRAARGETLAWGVPVEPLTDPIVIVLEQGDTRSAWDIAPSLPRVSRPGLCAISGVRPSGEVA